MTYYFFWLSKIFGADYSGYFNFISKYNPKEVFNFTEEQLKELNISEQLLSLLASAKIKKDTETDFKFCEKNEIQIIDFSSKKYPVNLRHIISLPPIFFCKGTLLPEDECSIAVIGSRNVSEQGIFTAKKFASELASAKVTIVSGMAYGTDSVAHKAALDSKGRTIAVLGSGIDVIYPEENKKLYKNITENGAVLSEFPLHTDPIAKNFPIRNRIVAGLSLGTLVIEANLKSGTMITARCAGEFGRNIYAVPGSIFDNHYAGTNSLIKDGAKLVSNSEDILIDIYTELNYLLPKPKQLSLFKPLGLSESESKIYNLLSLNPITVDLLVEKVNLPFQELFTILSSLEIMGHIKQLPGQQYVWNQ